MSESKKAPEPTTLVLSLAEVVQSTGLEPRQLRVAIARPDDSASDSDPSPRETVPLTDGKNFALWSAPAVRELFRGDTVPPDMASAPPMEYMPVFQWIEQHIALFCAANNDKSDQEFEKVFSQLRRRPDGKPLNDLHTFLWQVGALLCATRQISAAEFEAIFGRLARSARTFAHQPISRNYISTLKRTF